MFPRELKALNNWVCYHIDNKIPINARTGSPARSNDRSTWSTYEEAVNALKTGRYSGLGFMLEYPYIGIDLDDAITDGALNDFGKGVLEKCKSYSEYSPSRTGLHIIGKGKLNAPLKKPFLEVYQNERYFTVTQKPLYPIYPVRELDLTWLDQYREERKGPISVSKTLSEIKEGARNNDFAKIAGSLRSRGYSSEDMFELLRPRAAEVGFDEKELWSVCKSIGRYPPGAVNSLQVTHKRVSLGEFLAEPERVEWLVDGMVSTEAIVFFAGLPKSKKTWMLMDLAIEMARGGTWMGKFPVKVSKVLFLDQERSRTETRRRIQALIDGKNMSLKDIDKNLELECGNLYKLDIPQSYEAFDRLLTETKPAVVIVDSFKRFHTKNELATQDMQFIMGKIHELRSKHRCTFVLIHHETKGVYERRKEGAEVTYLDAAGTIDLVQSSEGFFNVVSMNDEQSMVHHTGNTQGPTIAPFIAAVKDLVPDRSQIRVEAQ